MPAYIIITRDGPVRDAAAIAEYQARTRKLSGFALEPLVVYGEIHPLEGDAPDAALVLRFPSVAEARAFYDSPGYQDALPYRLAGGDWQAIIVEGLPERG